MTATLDENYEAFKALLPALLEQHRGKFAVLHDLKVQNIFDTVGDAYKYAATLYQPGDFAIQKITEIPIKLGFFTNAVPSQSF